MVALRRSSFVECIERWCRVAPGRTACAFMLLELGGVMGVWCSMRSWSYRSSCVVRIQHNGDDVTNGIVLVGPGRTVCTFVWLVVRLNLKVLVFDLFDAVLYEIVISHSCVRFSKTLQWKWPPWGWSSLNVWNGRSGQTASMFARDVIEFEDFRPYYIGVQRSFGA